MPAISGQRSSASPPKNPGGRPLKFKNVAALQKAIDAYFESCWRETEIKSGDGTVTDVERRQVRPYTITGLALALDTSRKTLVEYEDRDEFRNAVQRAKLVCENYIEESLLLDRIPPAAGNFNLKNNYGWQDKTEVEQTNRNFDVVQYIREVEERNARMRE